MIKYSTVIICFVGQIVLVLAIRSSFRFAPVFLQQAIIFFFFFHKYFFILLHLKMFQAHLVFFLAPVLGSTVSLRNPDCFHWKMVLITKIRPRYVHCYWNVTALALISATELGNTCMHSNPLTYISISVFICIYIKNHEFILISFSSTVILPSLF